MQKKLLLMLIAANCVMICANDLQNALSGEGEKVEIIFNNDVQKEALDQELADYENQKNLLHKTRLIKDELADYEKEKVILYTAALVKALSGECEAIGLLAAANEVEYKTEEKASKKLQDDSAIGWFGSSATTKTINGRIGHYISERKAGKATINNNLQNLFTNHFNAFHKGVMPQVLSEIVHIDYELNETYLRRLDKCGLNQECLLEGGVSLPIIRQADFFDKFIFSAQKLAIELARKENIPLTDQEIINITKQVEFDINQRKLSVQNLDDSKKKILTKLDDLLHPKKHD